jgi:alpha-1,2-mannosyltransferase
MPRALLENPRLSRIVGGILLVLAAVMLVQTLGKAHRPGGYDFTSYLQSASALAHGTDPYRTPTPFPYIYPLFLAFVLIPLTALPYDAAVVIWFACGAACLCLIALLCARLTNPSPSSGIRAIALLALVGFLDPVQIDLLNGQVNLEVLLLCLLFFDRYRRKQWALASIFLGAAIALKLLPVLLLLFLLVRRELRAILTTAIATAVFCLAPALLAGRAMFAYYERYAREFLLSRLRDATTAGAISFRPDHLLASLEPGPVVHYAIVSAVLALLAWIGWRGRDDVSTFAAFCAFLVAMPLLSPKSEIHHLVLALPAAILLSIAALEPGALVWRLGTIGFWCCLWLGRVDRTGPFYSLALLLLMAGLVARVRSERASL